MTGEQALPLAGVRVLDLGRIYQGPWCGTLLALAGATVVKVEEPGGEPARQRGSDVGTTVPLAMLNSNKQAITLNLKHERGRAMLIDLVRQFDVLIENFGPGVMERLGLSAKSLLEVNPRLVYGGATGYGIDGPDRDRLALDITIQAHSGVMSVTGFPDSAPVKAGVAFIDFLGGTYLYGGIVTALYERERTGRGRIVDVAMIDTVYPTMASNMSGYYRDGEARRYGNGHSGGALFPYDVFPTSDGYVAILVVTTQQWPNFCNAMGRPELIDDERFASNNRRYRNSKEINAAITEWTSGLTRDEVVARLHGARVPVAAVRDVTDLLADPHLRERGAIQYIDHPELGPVDVPHSPIRWRDTPLVPLTPAPALGADNHDIYGRMLGLSADEVDRLRADGAI
jgi:CoA:oxalate CoA-transferase